MTARPSRVHRQRGAIAVMTALMLMLVLIPMGGLVIDLGHLYIAKAELQNMADAAALAAARDLDNSAAGVTKSYATGIAIAGKNKYDFNSTLTLTSANFAYAAAPDGPWYSAADTEASPQGRTFVRVNTSVGGEGGTPQQFATYLMGVLGASSTQTYGYAVAGRFVNTITPLGICAVDPANRTASYSYSNGLTEIVEFGFRRGMAYDLFSLGSLGGAAYDQYLINPVDSYPNGCDPANSSADSTEPFACTGSSAVLPTGTGTVYVNTGMSSGKISRALNSRFNDFSGGSKCDPASAPPDLNIHEFPCRSTVTNAPCVKNATTINQTPPVDWMDTSGTTYPNRQPVTVTGTQPLPQHWLPGENTTGPSGATASPGGRAITPIDFTGYGSLWAYSHAYKSDGTTPITPAEANAAKSATSPMYGNFAAGDYFDTAIYPTTVGGGFTSTSAAPYNQTGNANYFTAPVGRTGVEDRRILNIVLIDCRSSPGGGGSCKTLPAVGIGKFFMLNKADFGGGARLDVEFTGLVEPVPTAEVKLYR